MALLNEINVKGVSHPIVTDDGYYQEMTVGDAEQLVATQFVEDSEPYLFRPTGGSSDVGNRAYLDKIVGGTVAWNQVCDNFEAYGIKGTAVRSGNKYTYTFTELDTNQFGNSIRSTNRLNSVSGHKYLELFDVFCTKAFIVSIGTIADDWVYANVTANANERKGVIINGNGTTPFLFVGAGMNNDNTFVVGDTFEVSNIQLFDLTQMLGSTIADYIYSLEQSQAGAGVAWFKKLFPKDYYPYNAGELLSVEGPQSHDTVGFNQWDEEWEVGSYDSDGLPIASDDKIRTKNKISVQPSTAYYFWNGGSGNLIIFWYDDNDTVISYEGTSNGVKTSPANAKYLRFRTNKYGTTYNNDICINLSNPSRNGEYEPYEKHSYPLDSSLTLRGIPKLDASNNLYYDGDEYTSGGKVKRKYGVVVLNGSEQWYSYQTDGVNQYYITLPTHYVSGEILCACDKFTPITISARPNNYGTCYIAKDYICFNLDPTTFPTVESFKTYLASNNVTVVYPLATPTTETAEPFQHIQIVDDFGTEEFVSTGIVPVGHKTRYPANLRDKLQHLPSLASADGTYLIQQSGKQMSLIHMPAVFPEIPTEDGEYVLKATVSGGTPTYVWEGVNAKSRGE